MTQTFENWTEYDNWLIQNYSEFDVIDVKETESKAVLIEYLTKDEYAKLKAETEAKKAQEQNT